VDTTCSPFAGDFLLLCERDKVHIVSIVFNAIGNFKFCYFSGNVRLIVKILCEWGSSLPG